MGGLTVLGPAVAVSDVAVEFGESAAWDAERAGFWWVDMASPLLLLTDAASGRTKVWNLKEQAFAVAARPDGVLFLAETSAIVAFDPRTHRRVVLAELQLPLDVRLNDGRLGPDGSFVVGSLDRRGDACSRRAAVYRYDGDISVVARGFSAVNGIGWLPRIGLVFSDSRRGRMYRVYGSKVMNRTASVGPRRWPEGFRPDGAATDPAGDYWSAQFGSGEVWRWSPATGRVDRFAIDCRCATSVAFASDGRMAWTSARSPDAPSSAGRLVVQAAPFLDRQALSEDRRRRRPHGATGRRSPAM